ncbi:MAG TPA: rhodanese-like domain-containing protein [Pyrinomonadaceae bacterium]|jgi:3-mercaptopyruvate sulfurtransferase SseA
MRLLFPTAAGAALCAALLVAVACNPEAYDGKTTANNTTTAPAPATTAPVIAPAAQQPPAEEARRINVTELKQEFDAGRVVIVDVRAQSAYDAGHIKGAKLIPAAEIDKHVGELPKDKLIVTYCS